MNKLSVMVLLASMLTVFANADSQKDVEIAKEVGIHCCRQRKTETFGFDSFRRMCAKKLVLWYAVRRKEKFCYGMN